MTFQDESKGDFLHVIILFLKQGKSLSMFSYKGEGKDN